jgi:hypothetical protein
MSSKPIDIPYSKAEREAREEESQQQEENKQFYDGRTWNMYRRITNHFTKPLQKKKKSPPRKANEKRPSTI